MRARVRPQFGEHFDAVVVGEADEPLGQLRILPAPAHQQNAGRGVGRLLAGGGVHAALVPFKLLGGKEDGPMMRAAAVPAGGRCGCRHRITQCTPAAAPRIFARRAASCPVPEVSAVVYSSFICMLYSYAERAPLAQSVELRTFNPQVVGSSPTGRTERPVASRLAGVGGFCVVIGSAAQEIKR